MLSALINHYSKKTYYMTRELNIRHHRLPEKDIRVRYLTKVEYERLVSLAAPHLKPIIRFAVMTGQRKSNILNLNWQQIDFENNIITFYVKSRKLGGKLHIIPLYPKLKNLWQNCQKIIPMSLVLKESQLGILKEPLQQLVKYRDI